MLKTWVCIEMVEPAQGACLTSKRTNLYQTNQKVLFRARDRNRLMCIVTRPQWRLEQRLNTSADRGIKAGAEAEY